jgi:hypothetical protein
MGLISMHRACLVCMSLVFRDSLMLRIRTNHGWCYDLSEVQSRI